MNDSQDQNFASAASDHAPIGAVDLLLVMARRKRLLLASPVLACVLAAGATMLMPDTYKAGAKLLPAQQSQGGAAAVLAQLGGAMGGAASAGMKGNTDLYIGMLKSRTVGDALIARFDLKKVYGTESAERARKILEANTTIVSGKDGLIQVDVEDEDRDRVAKLANAYAEELMTLTSKMAVTEAAHRRLFFERQLALSKDNLAKAEMTLKSSLSSGGVISVDADSRAIVETVGRLRAQLAAKDIELNAMRAFVTPSNQQFLRAEQERNSLRAELNKLENGSGNPAAGPAPDRQGGLENIKTLREVKYHQMLYELLAKQYEAARLDEAKDSPNIQVLDSAVAPERKFKPKRAFIVLMAGFLGFLLALAVALLSEGRQRAMRDPVRAGKWREVGRLLKGKA